MPKIKPIVAETPEDLADLLGLPRAAAEEWQFQHVLMERLKDIARREKLETRNPEVRNSSTSGQPPVVRAHP